MTITVVSATIWRRARLHVPLDRLRRERSGTTPAVVRDTTTATTWDSGVLPAGAGLVIYVPLFHRDDRRLADADRFAPELWPDGRHRADLSALIPFSAGPAECPGRNLVLLITSTALAALLDRHEYRLERPGRLAARTKLPGTLNPFTLRFAIARERAPK